MRDSLTSSIDRSVRGAESTAPEHTRAEIEPGVTKSVLVRSWREPAWAVVICPSTQKVDLHRVARCLGWKRARLATVLELRAWLERRTWIALIEDNLPVLIDTSLLPLETILVPAGTSNAYVEVDIDTLRHLASAVAGAIVLPRWRWE